MADNTPAPVSLGIIGVGQADITSATDLINEWLPENAAVHLYMPDDEELLRAADNRGRKRNPTTLEEIDDWLGKEFDVKDINYVPDVAAELANDQAGGHTVTLALLPALDDPEDAKLTEQFLRAASVAGVPVHDLSQGMDVMNWGGAEVKQTAAQGSTGMLVRADAGITVQDGNRTLTIAVALSPENLRAIAEEVAIMLSTGSPGVRASSTMPARTLNTQEAIDASPLTELGTVATEAGTGLTAYAHNVKDDVYYPKTKPGRNRNGEVGVYLTDGQVAFLRAEGQIKTR